MVLILPGQTLSGPGQRKEILSPDSFFEYHASPNRAKVPRPENYLHKVYYSGSWNGHSLKVAPIYSSLLGCSSVM